MSPEEAKSIAERKYVDLKFQYIGETEKYFIFSYKKKNNEQIIDNCLCLVDKSNRTADKWNYFYLPEEVKWKAALYGHER